MPSTLNDQELVVELVRTLESKNSALATYFRSLTKVQLKDLFRNESSRFLRRGINELLVLENYELCAVFRELLDERESVAVAR
jgi:hypothetical protein